jgi:chloramphenicol O-acetyltransferase type A
VSIDVTAMRAAAKTTGIRAYPAQIWMLATAANHHPEFRTSLDENGNPGVWDQIDPLYTVLARSTETFSGIWSTYTPDFPAFYRRYLADVETWADGSYEPQAPLPGNLLNISSLPWLDFTGFNLNLPTNYLLPILTIGKYQEAEGRTLMPLAVQVHHAVCDGLHLARFVEEVRAIAASADEWMMRATGVLSPETSRTRGS